ncbi:hypothetical protein MOMUL_27610 [Moorella mulderi DSM 14980]|uniref:Uncharacterized protein n=1 Tax=Moorella mulderi DSM 14980 TaxID=1122241 RepID=A0A151AU83_9FIRM|nr:hypothetical protein MOMUL_27610 [Moorella mulderi DSM 14980]
MEMEIERIYSDDPADWEAVAEFIIKFLGQYLKAGA